MRDGLHLVQQALLEADVSLPVVKQFMARVTEQAVGEAVLKLLDPTQQLVKIVYDELVQLMGPVDPSLHLRSAVPVLMLCGLQGSGKTTTCGKLGRMVKQRGRKPAVGRRRLAASGGHRPVAGAGREAGDPGVRGSCGQGSRAGLPGGDPAGAVDGGELVILDTAGRLHIDQELMEQLTRIDRRVQPEQVYLVVDAMTGQDAVNSAKAFNEALELDGVIMTKLDGDARGGAALSVKAVTGVPIKFIGTGEQLDALEEFNPERMAGRILGHGRHVGPGRAGAGEVRPGRDAEAGGAAPQGAVHLGRLPQDARPDQEARSAGQGDEPDARHGPDDQDDGRRRHRRRVAPRGRHDRLDDQGRAPQSRSSSTRAGGGGSPRGPASSPTRSTNWSSSST